MVSASYPARQAKTLTALAFSGASVLSLLERVREACPRPIRQVNPEVPPWLSTIVARLQARDPDGRYESAQEVADLLSNALVVFRQGEVPHPPHSPSRVEAGAASDGEVTPTKLPLKSPPDWEWSDPPEIKSRPGLGTVAAILMVLTSVILAFYGVILFLDQHSETPPVRPRPPVPGVITASEEIRRFVGHQDWVTCVVFSPDGRRAISGSIDRTLRLWDLESGEELRRFEGHTHQIWCVGALARRPHRPLRRRGGR